MANFVPDFTTSRFSVSRRNRGVTSLGGLENEAGLLQAEVDEFGAPQIERDKPGFLARTIEVLSGWEYALAGATEEIGQGNGMAAALGRATSELYQSARSLPFGQLLPELGEPQRETFSEVFKSLGMGTTTLADVFPALEGSFLGELINTRGTLALATAVVSDPITYATFGLSAVAKSTLPRFAALGVKKGVTKKGFKRLNAMETDIRKLHPKMSPEDVRAQAAQDLLKLDDAEKFLDPGGMKFAGWVVPGTPGVGGEILNVLGEPIVNAANRLGFGRKVMQSADNYWDGTKAIMREVFSEFGPLELLPVGQREAARRMARKWVRQPAMLSERYGKRIHSSAYLRYFQSNPKRIEPVMDMLDGEIPKRFATEAEQQAAEELEGFLGEIAADGVASGIWSKKQVEKPSWIFHFYTNTGDEMSEVWTGFRGRPPKVSGRHQMAQHFETMKEGQRVSKGLNHLARINRAKGVPHPIYPELIPDYNIEDRLFKYIDWYTKRKAYHGLAQDFSKTFGKEIPTDSMLMKSIMDGAQDAIDESHKHYDRIKGFFGSYKSLAKMSDESAVFPGSKTAPVLAGIDKRIAGWGHIVKDARRLLPKLDDDGKRQFMHEMFMRVKSPAQGYDVMKSFADEIDFWPRTLAHSDELEDTLKIFGEQARNTQVGGNAVWGKDRVMIPRLIAEYADNADARIFNTEGFKGWRTAVRRVGRVNDIFKSWVYPFFPSSAFRDKMSNMLLSGLRIGWNAANPRTRGHTWASLTKSPGVRKQLQGVMGDGFTAANGRRYSHAEVHQYMRDHNVLISGQQWAELTEEGTHRLVREKPPSEILGSGNLGEIARNVPQPLTKRGRARALEVRAAIDNEDRGHLFVQGLMDGLSPDEAAADVAEYLFNYNELGAIHRDFIRQIVPFSTFFIKNTRLQFRMLRSRPGAVINQLRPFRGEHSENEHMVKFEAEGLKLRIDGDGNTVRMLTGIDLPIRAMDSIWNGGVGSTGRRLLGMMSPIIKIPIESATGTDLFTGRDTTRAAAPLIGRMLDNDLTPKWFKDWAGYRKRVDDAGRPQYSIDGVKAQVFIKGFVFSRLVSVSDRQFREYLDDPDPSAARALLDVATGLRAKDLNMDDQKRATYLRRISELEESLARRGRRATFRKRFTPKDLGEFQ